MVYIADEHLQQVKNDLQPKTKASFLASSLSIPLTRRLKKLVHGENVPLFPHKSRGKKKGVHAGCYNARASIRREGWQNETLCTFEPWNYRLVSPRQSPGVTDAIRACLDKCGGLHQHSHLSITAQVSRIKTTVAPKDKWTRQLMHTIYNKRSSSSLFLTKWKGRRMEILLVYSH